jgi:hypothetical protein
MFKKPLTSPSVKTRSESIRNTLGELPFARYLFKTSFRQLTNPSSMHVLKHISGEEEPMVIVPGWWADLARDISRYSLY